MTVISRIGSAHVVEGAAGEKSRKIATISIGGFCAYRVHTSYCF